MEISNENVDIMKKNVYVYDLSTVHAKHHYPNSEKNYQNSEA